MGGTDTDSEGQDRVSKVKMIVKGEGPDGNLTWAFSLHRDKR